jgi:hypothetical protein
MSDQKKYQYNMEWYDEYGVKTVIWDPQDPGKLKKDLVESGRATDEDIYIFKNLGQAHYKHNGNFYDGYRYDEEGNLYWEYDNNNDNA